MAAPAPSPSSSPGAATLAAEDVHRLGDVLGVWAHPDDETYLSGGLMAASVEAGNRVVCVTATDGEHGTADPHRWPPGLLAAERRREVRSALAVLGVDEHHRLGYEDGRLSDTDSHAAVDRLVRIMRDVRPDTVVTFGPDGITGHVDHRTISSWATSAALLYGEADVLYAALTPDRVERLDDARCRASVFEPGYPHPADPGSLLVDMELGPAALERKVRALEQHATQVPPVVDAIGREAWLLLVHRESFRYGVAARSAAA